MQALERAILSGELLRRVTGNCSTESNDHDEHKQRTETDEADAPASQHASDQSTAVQISVSPDDEPPAVQISGSPDNEANAVQISVGPKDEAPNEAVQISGSPTGKVTLRLRVPGDLLLHYRQLERLHRHKLPGTSFIQFLCATFWQTWVPMLGVSDKWETIYRRDRYRCTSPVCHQRNVTLHHVKYRASGGTDDPNNLTCPCAFCHLEGEHGGRLKILPPGSDPTWLLGRHPIMKVHHRERTLLA
jgi:hypothetical protein